MLWSRSSAVVPFNSRIRPVSCGHRASDADDSNPKSLAAYTQLVLEGVPCMEPQLNVTAGPGAFEWVTSWMPAGGTAGVVVALDESLPSGGARLRVMHGRLQSATCVTVVLQVSGSSECTQESANVPHEDGKRKR